MATFYGSDVACLTDLSLIDQLVTDPRQLIGERIVRLWTIPRGALGLIGGDPNRGIDVRQFVNQKITPAMRIAAQGQLENEALKDEQVQNCKVGMTSAGNVLTINAQITTSAGPFQLTLNVNALTVQAVFNFG
jgi:hypothetical protein